MRRASKQMRVALAGMMGASILCAGFSASAMDPLVNDYPTVARADYVFGCMAVNGQTREALQKCACSIDKIAELLPFKDYEYAETLLSVSRRGGENAQWLSHAPQMVERIKKMKLAQVEAELLCFN